MSKRTGPKPICVPLTETNWEEFLRKCLAKGLSVRSRYCGVYINKNGGRYCFMARYQGAGHEKWLGRFPLTKTGEKNAAIKYSRYLATLPAAALLHRGQIIEEKTTFVSRIS